jgi:hypothetical protein
MMDKDQILDRVAPEHREEFLKFIATGQASDAFIAYLDTDAGCQQAVDWVFRQQSADFDKFFAEMKANRNVQAAIEQTAPRKLASAISTIRGLPPEKQNEAVEAAASLVNGTLPEPARQTYAEDLKRVVVKPSVC